MCVRVSCFSTKKHSNENDIETCKRAHAIKSSFIPIECVIIIRHNISLSIGRQNIEIELILLCARSEVGLLPYANCIDDSFEIRFELPV